MHPLTDKYHKSKIVYILMQCVSTALYRLRSLIYNSCMSGIVTIIGGANMDINGFSRESLNEADSNPGRVEYCPGGVGRNIAENLHRLGTEVRFIGVFGDDPGGELIKSSSSRIGLNIEHSLFLKSRPSTADLVTSVYIALMDSSGEMKLALSDMDIMEKLTEEHLESKASVIEESEIVLLDTNLPEKLLCFIVDRFCKPGSAPGGSPLFFLDPVSARKAPRASSRIGSFDTLKLGRMEASVLTGLEIPGTRDMKKLNDAADFLLGKGVRRIFISLGKEGVYTASPERKFFSPVIYVPPLNTTGGGDAFKAGIVYGTLQGWDNERVVSFSLAMARIAVLSRTTVFPGLSLELVEKEIEMRSFT